MSKTITKIESTPALRFFLKAKSIGTLINKVNGSDTYFACINDLNGKLPKEEIKKIQAEFTQKFNIGGILSDYARRGDKKYKPSSAKIESNDSPTLYTSLGSREHIMKTIQEEV